MYTVFLAFPFTQRVRQFHKAMFQWLEVDKCGLWLAHKLKPNLRDHFSFSFFFGFSWATSTSTTSLLMERKELFSKQRVRNEGTRTRARSTPSKPCLISFNWQVLLRYGLSKPLRSEKNWTSESQAKGRQFTALKISELWDDSIARLNVFDEVRSWKLTGSEFLSAYPEATGSVPVWGQAMTVFFTWLSQPWWLFLTRCLTVWFSFCQMREQFDREYEVLATLPPHPHVVRLLAFFYDRLGDSLPEMAQFDALRDRARSVSLLLVMEYHPMTLAEAARRLRAENQLTVSCHVFQSINKHSNCNRSIDGQEEPLLQNASGCIRRADKFHRD